MLIITTVIIITIRGAREDLRVGVPARTRFRPAEILFDFALIGDCRLGHQNKKYKIKCFHRPPAPEFQESMTPKELQIKENICFSISIVYPPN